MLTFMFIMVNLLGNLNSFSSTNDVRVTVNDVETQVSVITNNGINYFEHRELLNNLGFTISYNQKYDGYQVLDYENWKLYCFKINSDYYSVTDIDKKLLSENTKYDNIQYEFFFNYSKLYLQNISQPMILKGGKVYISSELLTKRLNVTINKTNGLIEVKRNVNYLNYSDFYTNILNDFDDSDERFSFEVAYKSLSYDDYRERKMQKFLANVLNGKYKVDDQFLIIKEVADYKKIIQKNYWISDLVLKKEHLINATNNQPFYGQVLRYSNVKILDINATKKSFVVSLNGKGKYLLKFEDFEMYKELQADYPYCFMTIDPKKKFKWSSKTWANLEKYDYWTGMTPDMAYITMGLPNDVNSTVGSWGRHEQWVYEYSNYDNTYLYFENGKLTSWQD